VIPEVNDDCEKCKHFEECYYIPSVSDDVWKSGYKYMQATRKMELCVNNEKKNYEEREVCSCKNVADDELYLPTNSFILHHRSCQKPIV